MKKLLFLIYGGICYVMFLLSFLYAIGFVGNVFVSNTIDGEPGVGVGLTTAIITNLILLSIFAIQHSVMARPAFKVGWTKIVSPVIERSTYVLLSSLALFLIFFMWEPMGGTIWSIESATLQTILWVLCGLGWFLVVLSTFLIDHFELFGLKQVYFNFIGKQLPEPEFREPLLYKYVRHPLLLGFIIAFWATPAMSVAHFLFAAVTTVYVIVAIQLEEKDLVGVFGDDYKDYKSRVSMLFPYRKR